MPRSSSPRFFLVLGLACIVGVNAWLFGSHLTSWAADLSGDVLAPVASGIAWTRAAVSAAFGRFPSGLAQLQAYGSAEELAAQRAQNEALRREVDALRDAAGLRVQTGRELIEAGIFAYVNSDGTRSVLLNKGSHDGIEAGGTVATSRGVLIGTVETVGDRHARVRTVGDAQFEATARIVGTEVSGLVRTADDGTVVLDLVQKGEDVHEGQDVVTSGDDRYPAGLLIGTVRSVDTQAATLFLTVRLSPRMSAAVTGPVVILRP
ncbi:MAG: rod shape-determining protein MreC [Candidatus Yanofskybacteria bacterium]|nr:rod shape-determining protein MreC [Candidatus Yanofskybacteria bacterium]